MTTAVEVAELTRVVGWLTGVPGPCASTCEDLHGAVASATVGVWRVRGAGWSERCGGMSPVDRRVTHHTRGDGMRPPACGAHDGGGADGYCRA